MCFLLLEILIVTLNYKFNGAFCCLWYYSQAIMAIIFVHHGPMVLASMNLWCCVILFFNCYYTAPVLWVIPIRSMVESRGLQIVGLRIVCRNELPAQVLFSRSKVLADRATIEDHKKKYFVGFLFDRDIMKELPPPWLYGANITVNKIVCLMC